MTKKRESFRERNDSAMEQRVRAALAGPVDLGPLGEPGLAEPDPAFVLGGQEQFEKFIAEHSEIIEAVTHALVGLERTAEGQRAKRIYEAAARTGGDPSFAIESLTETLLIENRDLAALHSSAISSGYKGLGIGVSAEVSAVVPGAQAGAEAIALAAYKIGNYKTSSKTVRRAWYVATLGVDFGVSAGLGISVWLKPPTDTKHLLGAFISWVPALPIASLATPVGLRFEMFGWVPEKDSSCAEPELGRPHLHQNPFDYVFGFRLVLEAGFNLGLGMMLKGHQVVNDDGLSLSTYFLSPTTIVLNAEEGTTLEGTITAPKYAGNPSNLFTSQSELAISFPMWMEDCIADGATVSGLDSWTLTDRSGGTLSFSWAGGDGVAWADDIEFKIENVKNNPLAAPGQTGDSVAKLTNIEDTSELPITRNYSKINMALEAAVFAADVKWTLDVDNSVCQIKYHTDVDALGPVDITATTANSSQSPHNFYYIYDQSGSNPDDPPILTLVFMNDGSPIEYFMGYQFQQQQNGALASQIRAVMWRVGSVFAPANIYTSQWQTLNDDTYVDGITATFDDGALGSGNTLTLSALQMSST